MQVVNSYNYSYDSKVIKFESFSMKHLRSYRGVCYANKGRSLQVLMESMTLSNTIIASWLFTTQFSLSFPFTQFICRRL